MTEHRAHRRLAVDFDAHVTATGMSDQPCKVRDFCLGGVLLSFEDPLKAPPAALQVLDRGMTVSVRITTRSPGFRDSYTFNATVARRDRHLLGIAFNQPDPTALMALQSLANVSRQQRLGIKASPRAARFDEAVIGRALGRLETIARQHLADLPGRVVAHAAAGVAQMAAETVDPAARQRLLDGALELQRQETKLRTPFLGQALGALQAFGRWQPGTALPAVAGSSRLSLIDKDAFEEWLAIKVMVSRAEADCKQSLFELQMRLNELLGAPLGSQQNPLGPMVFLQALGEPLQRLKLPKPVEKVALKSLETQVVEALQALYPALNEALLAAGVLPELAVGEYVRRPVAAGRPKPPPKPEAAAPAPAEPPDAGGRRAALPVRQFEMQQKIAREAYGTVRRLLAVHHRAAGAGAGPGSGGSVPDAWSETAVRGALDQLQRVSAEGDLPLRERLARTLDPGGRAGKALPPAQAAAAETIEQLFGEMASYPLLRDEVKALLRRMEVPFLKLLLADEAFLSDDRHPARLVLNRLASLGARGAMTTPAQQGKVEEVVQAIADGFTDDPAVFAEALSTLDGMLARQRQVYEHNLQRVRQSSEGQQRIASARREVQRALEQALGGNRVPKALLTLLDGGWRELLVHTLLRHGRDSEAWQSHWSVVSRMAGSLSGAIGSEDIKALLGVIKHGLAAQATGQIHREAIIRDLRELFGAWSGEGGAAAPGVEVPRGSVDPSVLGGDTADEELAPWRRDAARLAVGDWIELQDEAGAEPQQARLAWVDADHSQFVFVNLQGMKVLDLDVTTVAQALRDGRARPIEDPDLPIVDRGLEGMVRKVYGQLAWRAAHDELTGLLSRKELERRLAGRLAVPNAALARLVLCWVDLDQLKVVNSTAGFQAGDELLRRTGAALLKAAGPDAEAARLGGDEFAVLADAGPLSPEAFAAQLLRAVEEGGFTWEGRAYPVSASVGVVSLAEAGGAPDLPLRDAEAACDSAKEAGRNRVWRHRAGDHARDDREDAMHLAARLHDALDKDLLQLRAQRIVPVDPAGGLSAHHELLLAISDEAGEYIPPGRFLQAAERFGRMQAIDRRVFEIALGWMMANADRLPALGGFAINLSGHSLNDRSLADYILGSIPASGIDPARLAFEVTETAAITRLADAAAFLRELKALGCRCALDDFGAGQSSFAYLKHLPVDYVKIDGSFVRDLARSEHDYMMVRAINEVAHFMGKQTVAEYVEDQATLEKLREIGVDFAQGFGIARPVPLDTL